MTGEFITLLLVGAAAGGFINGLAGFGTALFTLGFWLQILPAVEAVCLIKNRLYHGGHLLWCGVFHGLLSHRSAGYL